MRYVCIKPFQSEFSDDFFAIGNIISKEDYERLNFEEKGNFLGDDRDEDADLDKEEDFLDNNFPGLNGII